MPMNDTNAAQLFDIYLHEYDKLKDEAVQRIGFRDNLLYVNLAAIGAIISYAANNAAHYYALLIIPWVCFILGWTYLVNDEKISAIGRYIRQDLLHKLNTLLNQNDETLFGWEVAHRSDERRMGRKIIQFLVDEIAFCLSGLIAVGAFWSLVPAMSKSLKLLSIGETIVLLLLGVAIFLYSDFKKGK
jgi:hypothetical protein